jgi:regulator of protease activity HflC (stomatin/prohibitin superfamily)
MDRAIKFYFTVGAALLAALFLLMTIFGGFYTVAEGTRGVILRNGSLIGTAQPGFGLKVPFIDSIVHISVQDTYARYEKVAVYSKDQQSAEVTISVSYRIIADRVGDVYAQYGGQEGLVDRLITRKVHEQFKIVFGGYTAISAIQERAKLGTDTSQAIVSSIDGPLMITSVQIENVDFSNAYEKSVEERMLAEVAVAKENQNLSREKVLASIKVTQAQAEADSTLAKAKADAEAIQIKGEAEAKAITARAEALKNNAALIELVTAEKWDGKLPATMLPGSAVPFVSVK